MEEFEELERLQNKSLEFPNISCRNQKKSRRKIVLF